MIHLHTNVVNTYVGRGGLHIVCAHLKNKQIMSKYYWDFIQKLFYHYYFVLNLFSDFWKCTNLQQNIWLVLGCAISVGYKYLPWVTKTSPPKSYLVEFVCLFIVILVMHQIQLLKVYL